MSSNQTTIAADGSQHPLVHPPMLPVPKELFMTTTEFGAEGTKTNKGHDIVVMAKSTQAKRSSKVIAIDFDDVLASTNHALCIAHNTHFATDLTLDDFESYYVHRNRGWGNVEETSKKLALFHKEMNILQQTEPVCAVHCALKTLKAMGHPLHIVTARSIQEKPFMVQWLKDQELFDLFDGIHVIGAFDFLNSVTVSEPSTPAAVTSSSTPAAAAAAAADLFTQAFANNADKSSKVAILKAINAALLIDDHIGNVDKAAQAGIQCLLFGDYRWNARRWGLETPEDMMHYQERVRAKLPLPEPKVELLEGVHRTRTWEQVVEWVSKWNESH